MLIDGEPVVEIDIRASFLTILHRSEASLSNCREIPTLCLGYPGAW